MNTKSRSRITMSISLIFLQSLNPLEDWRMGVVPGRVQPVVDGEAEVVVVQLDQRRLQVLGLSHLGSKLVSLKKDVKSFSLVVSNDVIVITWNSKCLERTLMRNPMTAE